MKWISDILTGRDNQTFSIGRVMGITVFLLFVIALPLTVIATVRIGKVPAAEWQTILSSLQVYVPAILLSVGGLIGLTNSSDPAKDTTP